MKMKDRMNNNLCDIETTPAIITHHPSGQQGMA